MPRRLTIATSGAIIMSDVGRLSCLMWPGISAVEIGSLSTEEDLLAVMDAVAEMRIAWGMHMPLWRSGPHRVPMAAAGLSAVEARSLREDMALGARHHASYALAHAPWLPDHSLPARDAKAMVQQTMRFLADLQREHGVPVTLELKLGLHRDPGVLAYLLADPQGFLDLTDLTLCLDTGDWLLACEALHLEPVAAFEPFAASTAVIHVHAVERGFGSYLWKPIHPSDPDAAPVRRLCQLALSRRSDLTVVFEHTPHLDPGPDYDLKGYRWLLSELL